MKNLFKNIKGDAIEVVFMVPIWLFIFFYLGVQLDEMNSYDELEDAIHVSSHYAMTAASYEDCLDNISGYIDVRNDSDKIEFSVVSIQYLEGSTWKTSYIEADFEKYWEQGSIITIQMSRDTSYGSDATTFCSLNNDEVCFEIINSEVSSYFAIILTCE